MKNKILLAIIAILSVVLCVVIVNNSNHSFSSKKEITIKKEDNNLEKIDIEEYIIGVLAAEMPALFEIEALKAQAVAARSYAIYKMEHTNESYDILTTVSDQSYITEEQMKEKWQYNFQTYYEKIALAVHETNNEVMYYNNEVIEAFYFSMSNGYTENASTVFQEDLPYITSVPSSWEENLNNFQVAKTFERQEFCQKLSIEKCDSLSIHILEKSPSNRIVKIEINDQVFLGTEIREKLNLRSTDFEIEEKEEKLEITTKGYGHGVGMSQYGANLMAKEGYGYKDILNYYFQNIEIKKMV